ncbi:MAG: hypothetical protein ACYS1A_20225 [Planctomycetota bacterium]|jgi:hypothetical protein
MSKLKMYECANDFVIAESKKEATNILNEYFCWKHKTLPMRILEGGNAFYNGWTTRSVKDWIELKGKGYFTSLQGCTTRRKTKSKAKRCNDTA